MNLGGKRMKRLWVYAFFACLLYGSFCYGADNEKNAKGRFSVGYDLWYASWDVYTPDPAFTEFRDYDIDSTLVQGVTVSASSAKSGLGSWDFLIGAYGELVDDDDEDDNGKDEEQAEYFQGLLSYGYSEHKVLLTQIQWAEFEGELQGQFQFQTEWTKIDLLWMSPGGADKSTHWFGYGLRYTNYSMPLEFDIFQDLGAGPVKVGAEVYDIETKGIAFMLKGLDPIIFGYENDKWYFIDYDVAFGISTADADELKDSVYGFQFNFQIDAGLKHSIEWSRFLLGFKLGYRVFFDSQILAEWKDSDNQHASSTIRNFFHGPFFMIIGAF
jgi:hypothetical protein